MKSFHCRCGHTVFFDNSDCVACGAALGFDYDSFDLISWNPQNSNLRRCANGSEFDACNWLVPESDHHSLCWACRFNRTIPDMHRSSNRRRFRRFEAAKKRLLYTLKSLELPLTDGFSDPENGLLFDFIEDGRTNVEQFSEAFVQTGFKGGVITLNALEADDAARERARLEMNETYRTLLGHLRHESGHYFEPSCHDYPHQVNTFAGVFGDPNADYGKALQEHYVNGPPEDWRRHYISAYASAHPKEDWAECWAHYLFIHDVLETASEYGLTARSPGVLTMDERIDGWVQLSLALNEMTRSSGLNDPYPFIVNQAVRRKLRYIDGAVEALRAENQAPEDC